MADRGEVQSSRELPIVVAMTGASGAPYGVRLLEFLCASGYNVHFTFSASGAWVMREELGIALSSRSPDLSRLVPADTSRLIYHHEADFSAGIASGSFRTRGMVICPCSMSTLASVARGLTTNLITRAADVHLKERRPLILVPRETPLSLVHLESMTLATRAGAVVLPAMPGWYHRPTSTAELVDFVVARICDQLGVPNQLMRRWGDDPSTSDSPIQPEGDGPSTGV